MKTSYVLSTAFKVVGVVFFLKTLISVPAYISAIAIYINGLSRLSNESIPEFSLTFIVVAGLMLVTLILTTILIIYSDRIAKYLVESNDRDVGINPQWNVPDVLFISIQIIAVLIVVKGFGNLLDNAAKGACLIFNPAILNEAFDSKMRLDIGSGLIAGLLILIFGVAMFLLSHRITNFLDKFNRKSARPNI